MPTASRSTARWRNTCSPAPPKCPTPASSTWQRPRRTATFGQKGIGEGGAIGPPAAIANAVNDALHPLGVEITELPITPRRLLRALLAARVPA